MGMRLRFIGVAGAVLAGAIGTAVTTPAATAATTPARAGTVAAGATSRGGGPHTDVPFCGDPGGGDSGGNSGGQSGGNA